MKRCNEESVKKSHDVFTDYLRLSCQYSFGRKTIGSHLNIPKNGES